MSKPFAEIEDRLERIRINRVDVEVLLAKMDRDVKAAEHNRRAAPEWALAAAHQAIYDGCAAMMAAHGYRAKVNGHHKVAVQFARAVLPEHNALLDEAELVRRTRHRIMYGGMHTVPEGEVNSTLELVHKLAPILKKAALKALEQAGVGKKPKR